MSRFRLAYMSAELRTLGPLYEAKVISDDDEWQSQWVNSKVVHSDGGRWTERLVKALLFQLEEVELRNEGRAVWLNKVRIVLFNVQPTTVPVAA